MKRWFLIAAICLTTADVNNKVCWALCRRDGYDLGAYNQKHNACLCGQKDSFKDMTSKSMIIRGQSSQVLTLDQGMDE